MSATAETGMAAKSEAGDVGVVVRYRFRITLEGFMLLLVMILVGFAAWHSGTNLLYLIFAILIAFYLMHGALLWINLHKLVATQKFPETVVVNQPFDIVASLTNRKRIFSSSAISVTHKSAGNRAAGIKPVTIGSVYFSVVPHGSTLERFYSAIISRRGYHEIAVSALSTRYPFGFEERTLLRSIHHKILALPATYNVAGPMANIPFGFGDQESQVRGSGTDLYGLREYAQGEHSRYIHWRTSARAQKLIVSEFTRDERRQVMLMLNNGVADELRANTEIDFENAITFTASVARHLINAGYEVGLITADKTLAVGQGSTQLVQVLKHLATLEMISPRPIAAAVDFVIKIDYYNDDASQTSNWRAIDSRGWRPPPDALLQGEKLL